MDVDRVLLAILVRGTWPFPFKHRVLAGGSLETASAIAGGKRNSLQGIEFAVVTVVLPHSYW